MSLQTKKMQPVTWPIYFTFTKQFSVLRTPKTNPFKNIVEKGGNAGNKHLLLFPQYFLPFKRKTAPFEPH